MSSFSGIFNIFQVRHGVQIQKSKIILTGVYIYCLKTATGSQGHISGATAPLKNTTDNIEEEGLTAFQHF